MTGAASGYPGDEIAVPQVGGPIPVPASLRIALRAHWRPDNRSDELTQVMEDIWMCSRPVAPHADETPDDLLVFGCVIINDAKQELVTCGRRYALSVGSLYRINGRIEHATVGPDGLFAALIWDMPTEYSLADFERELLADPRWVCPC